MRAACRAARLLHIIELLRDRPRTVTELAESCEVSPGTIWRDLLLLQGDPLRIPLIREEPRWKILTTCK